MYARNLKTKNTKIMKIAIKNFITTLKRFKVASLLNIAGLALAFAAFYIIMAQVYSSFTFNSSIKDNERVYMLLGQYFHNIRDCDSFEKMVRHLRDNHIYLSHEGKEWLAFWS